MFDDNLRGFDAAGPTELPVGSQVHEDHPLLDLLRANYTFLNERLARHYGIPNIYGSGFRRVTLTDDRRFGLLGQASILTVTSYANRTSVVERGKRIWKNMLGLPTPRAAAEHPSASRKYCGRAAQVLTRTDGAAPQQSLLLCVSRGYGSSGLLAGKFRRHRRMAHDGRRRADRRVRGASLTALN